MVQTVSVRSAYSKCCACVVKLIVWCEVDVIVCHELDVFMCCQIYFFVCRRVGEDFPLFACVVSNRSAVSSQVHLMFLYFLH